MRHEHIETNSGLMILLILFVISIGGLVEIVPLFYINETVEKVDGVRPYTPLEMRGRDIYVREGCYLCHSQQIRPFRDEWLRYGHYSLAAESMYDHPFQWGSKRTGPDLARVGGRYSDEWHLDHLRNPRAVVPESIMPSYGFLENRMIDGQHIVDRLETDRMVGVPYTDDMIATALEDFRAQANPDADAAGMEERYPGSQQRNFDRQPGVSEMDALIAYLQVLGTMVDFSTFEPDPNR